MILVLLIAFGVSIVIIILALAFKKIFGLKSTEEQLGKIVGWNQDGFWLNYEQLIFELGNQTPKGHLPTGRSFILRRGKQAGMVEGVIPALLNESTMMAQKFVDCQI